jgi:hypothetical protein
MSNDNAAWKLDQDVIPLERRKLFERRASAGFTASSEPRGAGADNNAAAPEVTDAVGLALSGGGIRAAAFSLGVLQSFYRTGLLRYCDYLSTVSGGSYVGSFLTSLAVHPYSDLNWRTNDAGGGQPNQEANNDQRAAHNHAGNGAAPRSPAAPATGQTVNRVTLAPDERRRQSHSVQRLIYGASYLNRPLTFVNRWLPGFLQINIVGFSALVCVCALGAWLFRQLDNVDAMRRLSALGFSDDLSRAYFPSFVVFLVWFIVLLVKAIRACMLGRRGGGTAAQWLTLALIVTGLISTVSLMGVGDVDTSLVFRRLNINIPPEVIAQIQAFVKWGLYTIFIVGIIPYLSPKALLRSGAANAPWYEREIFRLTTNALFWGCPLALFAILATENISFYNSRRDDRYLLSRLTFKDWGKFWGDIQRAAEKNTPPSGDRAVREVDAAKKKLWDALSQTYVVADLKELTKSEDVKQLLKDVDILTNDSRDKSPSASPPSLPATKYILNTSWRNDYLEQLERSTPFWKRWVSAATYCFGMRDADSFEKLLEERWKYECEIDLATALANDQLLREDFSSLFEDAVAALREIRMKDGKWVIPGNFLGNAAELSEAYERAQTARSQLKQLATTKKPSALPKNSNLETTNDDKTKKIQASSDANDDSSTRSTSSDPPDDSPTTAAASAGDANCEFLDSSSDIDNESSHVAALPSSTAGPPTSAGDPSKTADDSESSKEKSTAIEMLDKLRKARLCDAVLAYHLAQHPDRHEWANDLRYLRDGLRREIDGLQHPLDKMSGKDEPTEIALQQQMSNLQKAHLDLVRAFYGDNIRSENVVFATVVGDADQNFRKFLFVVALCVFLATGVFVDLNATSMHGFYRDQLASVWLEKADPKHSLPLAEINTFEKGAPYLMVNCAMSFLEKCEHEDELTAPFLLSPLACGSDRLGYASTDKFEGGQFDLADAIAVSGAAVTPTAVRNVAVRALLWLMNFRLGQWLPNPSVAALMQTPGFYRRVWRRPQVLHLLLSWLLLPERKRDFHFVSDGGLHENLAIEPLLQRRCKLIIAVDAGADPGGRFPDLVKLLLRLRVRYGITISGCADQDERPCFEKLVPKMRADGKPKRGATVDHYLIARVNYPDGGEPGWLIYLRPGFSGDEPDELAHYREQNIDFPNDTTLDQFYEPNRFEAYRVLGDHIGQHVSKEVFPGLGGRAGSASYIDTFELLFRALRQRVKTGTKSAPQKPMAESEDASPSVLVASPSVSPVDADSAREGAEQPAGGNGHGSPGIVAGDMNQPQTAGDVLMNMLGAASPPESGPPHLQPTSPNRDLPSSELETAQNASASIRDLPIDEGLRRILEAAFDEVHDRDDKAAYKLLSEIKQMLLELHNPSADEVAPKEKQTFSKKKSPATKKRRPKKE